MKSLFFLSMLITSLFGSISFAQQETTKPITPPHATKIQPFTAQEREKMAAIHEKMATCLRSDRPLKECHNEMHEQYMEAMGTHGCPMTGEMGGRMHHYSNE